MIYVNNLRARNRGIDNTLRKLYLYISCNNIYRVPRKKQEKKEKDIQRYHQTHVQDHVQQQPAQPKALNMVRYKKAVYTPL